MTASNPTPDWLTRNYEEISELPPAAREAKTCFVACCERDVWLGGLCRPHHRMARKKFDPQVRRETNDGRNR
jgi:hypothetical protein